MSCCQKGPEEFSEDTALEKMLKKDFARLSFSNMSKTKGKKQKNNLKPCLRAKLPTKK